MVKTLSSANLVNIAATYLNPDILVEMPNISKQWSTGTKAGYETTLLDISPIVQEVDPLGGLAQQSDFTVTIQQETAPQFVQDLSSDNEVVEVYLQFGSDPKITLIKGRLDRWEYRAGELILNCIGNIQLMDKFLPTLRLDADNFPNFDIPTQSDGEMVPLTLGNFPDGEYAKGVFADQTPAAQKVIFNAVTSHEDIDGPLGFALPQPVVWVPRAREFIPFLTTVSVTDGYIEFVNGSRDSEQQGFVELILREIPISATDVFDDADITNEANAIDDDLDTFAEANDIAPAGGTEDAFLKGLIRPLDFPDSFEVLDDRLFLLTKIDRTSGGPINDGAFSQETCEAAIELAPNTYPSDVNLIIDVIADDDDFFDNLGGPDAETDLVFDTSEYAANIGIDRDGDGVKETLPVSRLGNRRLDLKYIEEQSSPKTAPVKILEIYEWRLRIDMKVPVDQEYFASVRGYNDDGSGTYTGSANSHIQNPADVIHFILAELLGITGINTTAFSDARSDLGTYMVAGQVFDRTKAEDVLDELARQSKLKLFIDLDDNWAARVFQAPPNGALPDRTLKQDDGDFVTDDTVEGEIRKVTQSSLDELYNQFEIFYRWDEATSRFKAKLTIDETGSDDLADWCAESQSTYNITRKLTVEANWIRDDDVAQDFGRFLVHQHADRKRIVEFQTSLNGVDLEMGDRVRLMHGDVDVTSEVTTVYSGYHTGDPLDTIVCGAVEDADIGDSIQGTAADSSGNNHDGTYQGTVTSVAPLISPGVGRAVELGGSDGDHVTIPDPTSLDVAQVTVEAWVRDTGSGVRGGVFEKSINQGVNSKYLLFLEGGWRWRIKEDATGNLITLNLGDSEPGEIVHLVGTYDGSDLRGYRDGVLVAGPTAVSAMPSGAGDARIGQLFLSQDQWAIGAAIDNVAVYNTALSPTRISAHHAAGTGGGGYDTEVLADSPVGYWKLDGAALKCGASAQRHHLFEIHRVETIPLDGLIRFTARQVDLPRAAVTEGAPFGVTVVQV